MRKTPLSVILTTLFLTACGQGVPTSNTQTASQVVTHQSASQEQTSNSANTIPITLERLNTILTQVEQLPTDTNPKEVLKILKDVPITANVETIFVEFKKNLDESVKAGTQKQPSDEELEIVKKLLALKTYEDELMVKHISETKSAEIFNKGVQQAEQKVKNFLEFPLKGTYRQASSKSEKEVLQKIETKIKELQAVKNIPHSKINAVKELPIKDLFILFTNDNPTPIITNKNVDYFIVQAGEPKRFMLNNVLDSELNEVLINSDKNKAIYKDMVSHLNPTIKHVWGNGERKLYVFSDPDCPYCREQDNEFQKYFTKEDNVTVYQVMNPLQKLHPFAYPKAAHLLCMPNPSEEWLFMQQNNGEARKFNKNGYEEKDYNGKKISECLEEVSVNLGFANLIGLQSTPSMITGEGIILLNKQPIDIIRKALNGEVPKEFAITGENSGIKTVYDISSPISNIK